MKVVGRKIRDMLAGEVASIVALLMTSLISTIFAIQGVSDLLSYVSIPYVVLFVYICYEGQQLQACS